MGATEAGNCEARTRSVNRSAEKRIVLPHENLVAAVRTSIVRYTSTPKGRCPATS